MFAKLMAAAALSAMAFAAQAGTHEVQMLNKGADGMMVFEPAFVAAEPGDTITFMPTDKSHNAATIDGMLPDGAEEFRSKPSQEFSVTLDKEGVYGIKCTPHYGMGMVMVIQVGAGTNLDEAKAVKHPGKAGARMEAALSQASAEAL
ncbi:MAG TPA: pseudoazurin [Paracoccaceae bacterium]|nr:pseudoazurin [Paracoccaceae bacterium]